MQFSMQPVSIGFILAVIVLIVALIFMLTGQLDFKIGAMFAALAVARLL